MHPLDAFDVSALWSPAFPTADMVSAAASMFSHRLPKWDRMLSGQDWWQTPALEGPRSRIIVGPGVLRVTQLDPARAERAYDAAIERRKARADLIAVETLLPELLEACGGETAQALDALASLGLISREQAGGQFSDSEFLASWLADLERRAEQPSRLSITSWSRKSRARMVRTLGELDYAPLFASGQVPAMLTLTYPGDWLTVAPNAAACKRHVDALKKRFAEAWGTPLRGVWKREFQRRGAPHYHILMVPPVGRAWRQVAPRPRVALGRPASRPVLATVPAGVPRRRPFGFIGPMPEATVRVRFIGPMPEATAPLIGPLPVEFFVAESFREWVSNAWADVVAHPDLDQRAAHRLAGTGVDYAEGLRAKDPARLGVYFSKHGSFEAKDYQNDAPAEWLDAGDGVGRFWGVWGLEKALAVVEVPRVHADTAARVMRRWARANGYTSQRSVWRSTGPRHTVYCREIGGQALGCDGSCAPGRERFDTATGESAGYRTWRKRKVRRRVRRMPGRLGFLMLNDAPAFAARLALYLDQVDTKAPPPV